MYKSIETDELFRGFVEGDLSWFDKRENEDSNIADDLILARDFNRPTPVQLLEKLVEQGHARLDIKPLSFTSPEKEKNNWRRFAMNTFTWSDEVCTRFARAKEKMNTQDVSVLTQFGELINPDNPEESRHVMFIAAGGVREGLVTARGVYQMRMAMEQAQDLGLPLIFLNAITSADFSFESEVGQISRQISDTMALGLNLTVPKITVVTGEAASAGAHSAWQIADTTLILEHGALLTVINPEEALQLLRFNSDISAEANQRFLQKLKAQTKGLTDKQLESVTGYIQGINVIAELLSGKTNVLESEDQLRAVVRLAEAVSSKERQKVMLIMPADNPRYVEGMLTREADMLTIHADDWQSRAEVDTSLTKAEMISQVKEAMMEAWRRRTQSNTPVYFRLKADNFSGFWNINDVRQILTELYGAGLNGIRFTETVSVNELSQLTSVMRDVESELGLPSGAFRICLSVEDDEAIEQLNQVVQEGDQDRRIASVVFGVRDYTKSKIADGVRDREWSHPLVEGAKIKLVSQIKQLRETGWSDLRVLHAVASLPNDYSSIHREVVRSLELGADGMLAISPEQISHVKGVFEGIFSADGNINRDRLEEILQTGIAYIDRLPLGKNSKQLSFEYSRILYQVFHDYRLKLLQAGGAFPNELKEIGIVDGIISAEDGVDGESLVRELWRVINQAERMDENELRTERLMKLAKLGARTVTKSVCLDRELRRIKAQGRGQKAAEFWVDLLTKKDGFSEEILNNLAPDISFDVLVKMGRKGNRSYAAQLKEAQEKTGTLAGIVAGYTKIEGRNVLLIVRDQDFINATAGASTGEIVRRASLDAIRKKKSGKMNDVAICYVDVSAGGRVQEGALALAPSELALAGLVQAREAGIPVINAGYSFILGSDGIGPFYQADRVVLIGKHTELGLAGRRIVERASLYGKGEFPSGFRLADYHLKMGNIDSLLEKSEDLLPYLEKTLAML